MLRHVRVAHVRARGIRRRLAWPVDADCKVAHVAVAVRAVLEPDLVCRGAVPVRLELALKGDVIVADKVLSGSVSLSQAILVI